MDFKNHLIIFLVLSSFSCAVKVNMHGSISFGRDIMDTLSSYINRNNIDGRRSAPLSKETDELYLLVKSSYICRDLNFCDDDLEIFLNEYITLLTRSVEAALSFITAGNANEEDIKNHIFTDSLNKLLTQIKNLLITIDGIVTEKTAHYHWADIIKQICAMFQESAINYSKEQLLSNSEADKDIKKKVHQKIVIDTVGIESAFEVKLCSDHNYCPKSYECTKGLHTLFGAFENLPTEKARAFVKYVAEALLETAFYSHLNTATVNELQIILDEMTYSNNVTIKDVLHTLYKTVEKRLDSLINKKYDLDKSKDVELAHIILSDMDHFYTNRKVDPFHVFSVHFFDWVRMDKKILSAIHDVMDEISYQVYEMPELLIHKLQREVKVFLEITVEAQ